MSELELQPSFESPACSLKQPGQQFVYTGVCLVLQRKGSLSSKKFSDEVNFESRVV